MEKWSKLADIENSRPKWPILFKRSVLRFFGPISFYVGVGHFNLSPISYRLILDRSVYNLQPISGRVWLEPVHEDLILNPSKCYNLALSIFRFVLAGCFSQWYWTQSKEYKYLQENPLSLSFGFVLKNFGTLASGSIFMTVLVVSQARAPQTAWLKIRFWWSGPDRVNGPLSSW